MAASGPAAVPTPSVIPSGGTQDVSYQGRTHPLSHNDLWAEVVQLWTKLGITDSPAHDSPLANTVLASLANGKTGYRQVTAGDITPGTATLLKVGEVAGTGSSAVMEIASIPSTYRALLVHVVGRGTNASTLVTGLLTFESSPTAGHYDHQEIHASNATVTASENVGASDFIYLGAFPANTSTANLHGAAGATIYEYANTGIWKPVNVQHSGPTNLASGGLFTGLSSGVWEDTAAIVRVRASCNAGNWASTSRMTVWGVPA